MLVVEDNPIDQLVIASALRRVGYTPEIAPSTEEAAAAIARNAADVVFVDVASAGDEGYTRAASLRQACDAASSASGQAGRTPIIALVGRVRDEERAACRTAGIDDLLGKPVDLEALVATVGHWIETRGEETPTAVTEVPTVVESPAAEPSPVAEAPVAEAPVAEAPVAAPVAADAPAPEPSRTAWLESNAPTLEPVSAMPEFAPPPPPPAWARDDEWTPAPEPQPAPSASSSSSDPTLDALPVFDAAALESASMGNGEIRGMLVNAFLTRTKQPLDRLRKAAEWKDAKAVEFQAHAMRGMCESVGAVRCGAALGKVEQWAATGQIDEAVAGLARVEAELATVRSEWSSTEGDSAAAKAA